MLYVLNNESDDITPIRTATNTAEPVIHLSGTVGQIALTPDGRTLYVSYIETGTVISYSTATGKAGQPISLGQSMGPEAIVFTPDGRTAYVADGNSSYVTPIDTATSTADPPIRVGKWPEGQEGVVIAPDGRTVYALNFASGTVTPIDTATNKAGRSITIGLGPIGFLPPSQQKNLTPSTGPVQMVFAGSQAWVLGLPRGQDGGGTLTPVSLPADEAEIAFPLTGSPFTVVIAG